ncbi:MAG: PAS domain S-box protein [Betaproteobacteria bacterium]
MKRITASVIRTTTRLAFGISLILAFLLPFGYLVMSYERQSVVLETEAEAAASLVSQLISTNPEYWRYEQPRLDSFLSRRPFKTHQEIWRIVDDNDIVLAQHRDPVERPLITRLHPLYDSGKIVGRVEISRSLRPFLLKTLGLGLLGLALGAGSFFVFRVFPLRALGQALQSLQQSEARFRAIASTAADGIIVIDDHGNITFWNHAAEKMFGYTPGEAVGRELHTLIAPPAYHKPYRLGFERFIQTGIGPAIGNTLEFTAIRKNGTEFPIEVSTSAVELNGAWHAVGIIRNIGERKRTESELLKIEKLESLGVLAGGIAHDFNNLLTVVLGSISLAQLDADPSGPMYQRLSDGEKAVLRARDLTQQLLTFARGGAPVRKTASIHDIVEEACGFSLSGSNVKCTFSFGESLRPVDVDAGQISQVIHNLVINAGQAMPDGGSIHVSCQNTTIDARDMLPLMDGRYVKISVKDQGIGIPREILSKIFDPYFTTKPKGSGLGLATSYSIVKKHGGYIGVESEPGAGSIFHVYLPASLQELPAKPPQPKGPPGKGKILVMDDEEAVRQIVGEMLKSLGYDPSFARDGLEALAVYQRAAQTGATFNAVIMDLTIPGGMGGKEAIRKMLELDPRARVIAASGYSNDPIMADFESHGFSGVIAKPYTMDVLATTLNAVMA